MGKGFFKDLIGIEEDDDDEDLEDFDDLEEIESERKPLFGGKKREKEEAPAPVQVSRPAPVSRPSSSMTSAPSQRPVSSAPSQGTMSGKKFTDQFKMVVIKPQGFEDSPKLVDSLKSKKPVIINLEDLETDVARKVFDFLSGATYALNGKVQKIANNIFLFSPENVDVSYNEGPKKVEEPSKSMWS